MNNTAQVQWNDVCAAAATKAARGCGCSDTVFSRNLHAQLQPLIAAMPEGQRDAAQEIAKSHGYMTSAEIAKDDEGSEQWGFCSHGLDPHWCPVGCGDIEF